MAPRYLMAGIAGLLIAVGPAGLPGQVGAPVDSPSEVERIIAGHADALVDLSETASQQMLFNDVERLLLSIEAWSPADPRIKAGLAALRERRIGLLKDDDYLGFLKSKRYGTERERLRKAEEQARARTVADLLRLLGQRSQEPGSPEAARAAEAVFTLDPTNARLRALVGKAGLESLREQRRRERGIERLELGATVAGAEVSLQDLQGKVILWRSFSL